VPAIKDHDVEEIRARCQLPQMDIEIIHRIANDGDAEFIAISLQMVPLSQRFERLVEMSDPFRFWGQVAQAAWWPWLQALRAASGHPALPSRVSTTEDE
jgi:hypothetical protein